MKMEEGQGFLLIKKHSYKKYRVLQKYLGACRNFQKIYKNFVYVDTHGGSGKVFDKEKKKFEDGSPLIARRTLNTNFQAYPCYIIEVEPAKYNNLKKSTNGFKNIKLIKGDCNKKILDIIGEIEEWKFILCFIDPDGLIEEKTKCHELSWETVEIIAKQHPKTEILLNFPLEAILRSIGYAINQNDSAAKKHEENVTKFFGSNKWREIGPNRRKLLELFISERLNSFEYVGAILIKADGTPLYYLIYATHHPVGATIMRGIMRKEWNPEQQTLVSFEELYPLNKFIFGD